MKRLAAFERIERIDFVKASLVAILVVLVFGLIKSYGPSTGEGTAPKAIASNTTSNGAQPKLTSPSSFPNIKIENFGQMDEHFYRGAQPKPDDYTALAALGIKTVIDLRDDPTNYEKPGSEAAGMHYVSIPMSDKRKPSPEQIEAFLAIVKDKTQQPFYVHCVGGRHRTGLIGAVYRYSQYGWDFDQVYREMKNYDYYSRWGHSAIKDYVKEYYDTMKAAKTAVAVSAAPAVAPIAKTSAEANAEASQPVTEPPPPKPNE